MVLAGGGPRQLSQSHVYALGFTLLISKLP
jgi:hypothetical protein